MKICYVNKRFSKKSKEIIQHADQIIVNYQGQGLRLTLRQLYYRFVAAGLIPNTERNYKQLGSIINDARLAGMLDWEAIEDRSRNIISIPHWTNPGEIIIAAANGYSIDKWIDQEYYVEVWVEKQALESVVSDACRSLDITCFACKGYVSQSEMWRAAMRIRSKHKHSVIIHLGDHDPSGIDMTRDIQDRLSIFCADVEVRRIALNMNQIEQYNPPPNPAKITDTRFAAYSQEHGDESWELDALEPSVLKNLIQTEIRSLMNEDRFNARMEIQIMDKARLLELSNEWELNEENT